MEDYVLVVNIIAEAKTTEGNTPLAFAPRHVGTLLDIVGAN
jgi:hypothetical protein